MMQLALLAVLAGTAGGEAALLRDAAAAERAARPEEAADLYARAAAASPGTRLAASAERRLRWLEERAAAGWEPVRALLAARALPRASLDAAALWALEGTAAGLPPGLARRELRALVADAWLDVLDRPAEALAAYEDWAAEPGLRAGERHLAAAGAARARARAGDVEGGLAALAAAGLADRPEAAYLRYLSARAER